nr:MAG TPA: hypothetical protein [Microviridae sp.]
MIFNASSLFVVALWSGCSAAFALGSLHSPKHWRAGLLRLINFLITQYLDDPRYGVFPMCNVRTCASRVRAKFIFGYNCKNKHFFLDL